MPTAITTEFVALVTLPGAARTLPAPPTPATSSEELGGAQEKGPSLPALGLWVCPAAPPHSRVRGTTPLPLLSAPRWPLTRPRIQRPEQPAGPHSLHAAAYCPRPLAENSRQQPPPPPPPSLRKRPRLITREPPYPWVSRDLRPTYSLPAVNLASTAADLGPWGGGGSGGTASACRGSMDLEMRQDSQAWLQSKARRIPVVEEVPWRMCLLSVSEISPVGHWGIRVAGSAPHSKRQNYLIVIVISCAVRLRRARSNSGPIPERFETQSSILCIFLRTTFALHASSLPVLTIS